MTQAPEALSAKPGTPPAGSEPQPAGGFTGADHAACAGVAAAMPTPNMMKIAPTETKWMRERLPMVTSPSGGFLSGANRGSRTEVAQAASITVQTS